jgi:hypothetical protein
MAAAAAAAASRRKKDESDDEDVDVDELLREPIVLTADVRLFTTYTLPTGKDAVICTLPPNAEKPWRVEMSSDDVVDGGVARVLRVSRRGVMFFCDGDTVELSISLQPVTILEAVYENAVWEPADGFVALDTAPLDRHGHPPEKPQLLLIMQLPPERLKRFEMLAVLFGRCTKRSARRHRDAKPISIVARHGFKNEADRYAARLAEEEEARKKAEEEGVALMNQSMAGGRRPQQQQPAGESPAAPAALKPAPDEFDEEPGAKKVDNPLGGSGGGGETPGGGRGDSGGDTQGLLTPTSDALEEEVAVPAQILCINPFTHDLVHMPSPFDSQADGAEMTALDAAHLRRRPDRDTDAQLFTKTRALYFGSERDDRSHAATAALDALLQRGRELAALGKPKLLDVPGEDPHHHRAAGAAAGAEHTAAGDLDAVAEVGDSPDVSPSRHKSFMEAFAHRETTRVQKAQLDAFFADADAERRDRQAAECARLAALLKDVGVMTKNMRDNYKANVESRLSGMGAPRRRTPPWVRAEPPRKPPQLSPAKMHINTDAQGKIVNPFSAIGRERR